MERVVGGKGGEGGGRKGWGGWFPVVAAILVVTDANETWMSRGSKRPVGRRNTQPCKFSLCEFAVCVSSRSVDWSACEAPYRSVLPGQG